MDVTLITGASGGIGQSLAYKLAERKHNLLLVARSANKLAALCTELTQRFGIQAQYIEADLMKPDAAAAVFAETNKRGLSVDWLINNVGIGAGGEFVDLPLQGELDMMQLNMSSLVALTHYFLPAMRTRKKGTLINVASMAAFIPSPYMAVYAATKVFVRSFTEAMYEECKPHNVRVMLLCPGLTKTNFMDAAGLANASGKALTDGAPLQTPDQVADEALKGIDAGKRMVVSGAANKWMAKMTALAPNSLSASYVAKSYRSRLEA